ncbi:MAG TPA: formyltransferase family protein [Ramlibacter sp.]|jgi:UDP-4-amino-4-deoxy-L-arabinose formyltransferase/UDP-glucuronic acid dehydrogenase (UDP-4-keto-hexauronic acid decarboxylating)|nr:formyltransferase family protein [Ramlibacter sp.]
MKVAIIGRSEIMYDTALLLRAAGHEVRAVVTAKEAPEYTRGSADFRALAESWGVPFLHTAKITEAEGLLRAAAPLDIGISYNYSGIIPGSIIGLFRLGVLNAHGGDLPRYRGNACQAWAILNGEDRVGLCVHSMVPDELDSGDIIARDYFPLTLRTKVTAVHEWMQHRVPQLFGEAVAKLQRDPRYVLEVQSKDPKDALRCHPRRPEDGRIDWRASAEDILRLVNACNKPYAGAFCRLDGKPMVVWDADLGPEENYLAVPGQVARIGADSIDVATGRGLLTLKLVEADGAVLPPARLVRSARSRLE